MILLASMAMLCFTVAFVFMFLAVVFLILDTLFEQDRWIKKRKEEAERDKKLWGK